MNIEKHRAFIDSLEGEQGLPEEMYGFNLRTPVERLKRNNDLNRDSFKDDKNVLHFCDLVDVLLVRIEHLESRQIPDLKEKVKELVLDAMDAEDAYAKECLRKDPEASVHAKLKVCDAFRALCEPEKDSKEVKL